MSKKNELKSCIILSKPACALRTGLAEVRELVFRQPGTDDDWKTDDEDNEQKLNSKCPARYEAQ